MSDSIRAFALPDLGEGLTESEIVAWRVAVGDHVELNQIVADVETAKAVVELPSPFAGVITALHASEGETVNVGAPIFSCDTGEGAGAEATIDETPVAATGTESDAAPEAEAKPVGESAAERTPTLVGYGAAADRTPKRRARRSAPVAVSSSRDATEDAGTATKTTAPAAQAAASTQVAPPARPAERPRSTPPVRHLAHELGVDLEAVTGTGENGLITRADVQAAASGSVPAPSVDATDATDATDAQQSKASTSGRPSGDMTPETRIPVRGVRKLTAEAMVRSAFTAPHVSEFLTIDVTATMELVRGIRDDRAYADHRVTVLAVVAKALCIAAARTPEVNARWDDESHEIVQYGGVNLGIAAATERGLIVPNIKSADRMTLLGLADEITALAETARAGRTSPADFSGGTISITNVGVFGVDAGTPILNPGEAAILAMGQVRRQPWEFRGEIALREVMTLSLSFDHRLVDGAQGSRFLADIGAILRDPARALLMM